MAVVNPVALALFDGYAFVIHLLLPRQQIFNILKMLNFLLNVENVIPLQTALFVRA